MAQYIFETDGSYVNFNGGGGLWRLARASNCIAWRFDETGDLFFDVYDQQYIVKAENISDVVIDETPLAAASDFPDAITAVFTGIGSGGGSSYLVYTALITQSDEDAPTAIVLQNTLSGAIVWTRSDVGAYIGTLSGAFTADKTFATIANNGFLTTSLIINRASANTVELTTGLVDNTPLDSSLNNTPIEIRVYP